MQLRKLSNNGKLIFVRPHAAAMALRLWPSAERMILDVSGANQAGAGQRFLVNANEEVQRLLDSAISESTHTQGH